MVFCCFRLEELDALLTESNGNLYPFLPESKLFGWRKKVLNDLGLNGFIGVFDFRAHKLPCPFASSRRQICELPRRDRKTNCENAALDFTETKITFFSFTMTEVFGDDTTGISEGILCQRKRHCMFFLIFSALVCVPLKPNFLHKMSLV